MVELPCTPMALTERKNVSSIEALRVPPHSIEAEQAVLGGLMLAPESWDRVADRLTEDDFYRRDHRLVFRAIGDLSNKGMPYDAVTLGDWFEAQGLADQVGGAGYVIELANSTPSAANITAYADIVRKRSVLRQLVHAATEISEAVYNPAGRSSEEILDFAEQSVFGISEQESRGRNTYRPIKELLVSALDRVDDLLRGIEPQHRVLGGQPRLVDDLDRVARPRHG